MLSNFCIFASLISEKGLSRVGLSSFVKEVLIYLLVRLALCDISYKSL